MKNTFKKIISITLVFCVIFSSMYTGTISLSAAESTPTVEIVSFMRGAQKDLRSSELLEARLTGYDGNVQELTYEWTNSLGTYLYVYNSHNMYYINTPEGGEVEIYNNNVNSSTNMAGKSYKDTFSGVGYRWASIYGSTKSGTGQSIAKEDAYNGTISVKVKDKNGNVIAQDSHTGTVTTTGFLFWKTTTYDGIIDHSLQADMDNVTIGMFEGDKRNVKDLLGESAILHITCVESTVSNGSIENGKENITLTNENGDYYITGDKAGTSTDNSGDAQVTLTIKKNTCKFHEGATGTATTTVYVFKKPTTSTTAYTLSLTGNLDDRCSYYIDGKEGVEQEDGTILFDGLNPNTQYMVEVKARYEDENNERFAYAFVYDTTKPIYTGTVEVYLDGEYDSATHTVTGGTKIDLTDVTDEANQTNKLYAKAQDSKEFIELTHKSTGTYSNILDTGLYNIYYEADESTLIDNQILTMHQADRTRYLFYNSVTYKSDDKEFSYSTHLTDSKVDIISDIPQKEGYYFAGWIDENGNVYMPDEILTESISKPYVLTAKWEKGVDVYVNITIDHKDANGEVPPMHDSDMHGVTYDLMTKPENSNNYEDVVTKNIEWDCKLPFEVDGYSANYTATEDVCMTSYTAITPLAVNVPKSSDYTVEIAKTGYDLVNVEKTTDDKGNVIINATLKYAPKNHDFKFYVELDEEAKNLPAKILPVATHVKVSCWYTPDGYDEDNWSAITHHKDAFVTVPINSEGVGEGTYPVWATKDDGGIYYYRIQVVSYLLPDGTILPAKDATEIEKQHILSQHTDYCTEDLRYHAHIEVAGGDCPDEERTTLDGAYFEQDNQQGMVKAIISVATHTVTFEPNNGVFSDGSTENKMITNQVVVPDLSNYTVTREDGYVFDGWYLVESNIMTDKTVSSGDELFKDITLRAKWRDPLTIRGYTFVAGYYHLNDQSSDPIAILMPDRTHHVTVYLQKILPNGYAETIDSQMMNIAYSDSDLDPESNKAPIGSATYQFSNIPDDGHKYRVLIQNPNYIDKYQNEPSSIDQNEFTDFENKYYTEEENDSFMAEFGDSEPNIANINLFLEFEPLSFDLKYQVDATRINEGFRPSNAEVLVLYDDGNHGVNPQEWAVISQMRRDDAYIGNDTKLETNGLGKSSYPVWINKPDGHTLYDYSVLLKDYTINGTETQFNATSAPFYVFYNGSARYSAISTDPKNQTQLLNIELRPRRYVVTFDLNFTETEEDHITGMEKYYAGQDDKQRFFSTLHLWSFETDFSDAIPKRAGYKFLGWYDEKGNKVYGVAADVAKDVTVTAKWEKVYKVTFHANNDDIEYDIFRTYYEYGATFDDNGKNFSLSKNGTLDSFYDIPEYEYSTHNKYIFKGWYLDKDNSNDSRPIDFNEVYTEDTDIYAHWIHTGTVEKHYKDSKITSYGDIYPGYDLIGVQIRNSKIDNTEHYGNVDSGLRFVTVLSEDVYKQINKLSKSNSKGAEYGFALAKTATAQKYCSNTENYEIEYKGENVNGVNTTATHKYVANMKCSGVSDHFNSNRYRLYTTVVTYTGLTGNELTSAQSQKLLARSYIRYTDANGLLRTHYNNYTSGSQPNGTYGGCSSSYNDALALTKPVG